MVFEDKELILIMDGKNYYKINKTPLICHHLTIVNKRGSDIAVVIGPRGKIPRLIQSGDHIRFPFSVKASYVKVVSIPETPEEKVLGRLEQMDLEG